MDRTKTAADLITDLARLIVGHPDKLTSALRSFGDGAVLIISSGGIKMPGSDTGRLVGSKGEIVRALNFLGEEMSLERFEVRIEDGTEDIPKVESKPWKSDAAKKVLSGILNLMFNGAAVASWDEQRETDLIEVSVGNGFDMDRLDKIKENLSRVLYAAGRAHGRVIRIWMTDKVKAVAEAR